MENNAVFSELPDIHNLDIGIFGQYAQISDEELGHFSELSDGHTLDIWIFYHHELPAYAAWDVFSLMFDTHIFDMSVFHKYMKLQRTLFVASTSLDWMWGTKFSFILYLSNLKEVSQYKISGRKAYFVEFATHKQENG